MPPPTNPKGNKTIPWTIGILQEVYSMFCTNSKIFNNTDKNRGDCMR